ncbi:MAG: hypothetical protein WAV91_09975 [Aquabacterium sp.]
MAKQMNVEIVQGRARDRISAAADVAKVHDHCATPHTIQQHLLFGVRSQHATGHRKWHPERVKPLRSRVPGQLASLKQLHGSVNHASHLVPIALLSHVDPRLI